MSMRRLRRLLPPIGVGAAVGLALGVAFASPAVGVTLGATVAIVLIWEQWGRE